ncbi:DEHA2G23056p [Debaryomyces hansenii CBS767]|jgi:fission process protein 1|uniref:Mitochondrial fission process protein 1 n=1 Tax=Debaryomyces hansenii (strain ATCC 36239 / CBS 767 / BCRC 21394 / JCM 1990 / NBRC 0083 / IGC 2968) TaxID=284592 RepID=Q6BGX6_DEBHA|nr:DEHA2G23056p [Debaryomyces hansenii CBS767]CAG91055.1 DEHA2G23056p [Debaryomyces hansenii CBS767]|eukprot:XP_462545.1 DEHA2G23056p [Debaryomyces hansenii CBS767]
MSSVPEKVNQVKESLKSDTYEEESNLRYAAYANRFRTILVASHRYVAYTSDIGESFRPVAHPYLVKMGYGVSWLYILGDVSYAAWKVKAKSEGKYTEGMYPWNYPYPEANPVAARVFHDTHEGRLVDTDWRLAGLKRGLFQTIASMGLPAFTIHSAVRYSSLMFKNSSIKPLKTYGPVAIGLGIVPLLPYVFDEPCEVAIDWIFDKGEDFYKQKLS